MYEHDTEGVATVDSLAALKDSVRNGRTAKGGVRRISALATGAAASARDDTICFLPSLPPLITDRGAYMVLNCAPTPSSSGRRMLMHLGTHR